MYKCQHNHDSETADFCSVCGAELAVAPVTTAPPAPAAAAGESVGRPCPDCGTPSESPNQVFCEVCGHNFQTGSSGVPPVRAASAPESAPDPKEGPAVRGAPPVAAGRWGVTVRVDPCLYGVNNPDAPLGQPPQVFSLFEAENLIGRLAPGVRAQVPVHNDAGVSRRHAMLLRTADGGLSVRDLGSANGTQLNGVDLVPGVAVPLEDGDCIALGAWTKMVVNRVSS